MAKNIPDKRKYIRISTVLPVEFYILDHQGRRITPWLQGFCRDIGRGGIRLLINDLWWGFWDRFNYRDAQLIVRVNFPFRKRVLSTRAKVSWFNIDREGDYNQYNVGIEFLEAAKKEVKALFKYAIFKKSLPFVVSGIVAVFCFIAVFSVGKTKMLAQENINLVRNYVSILDKSASLEAMLENGRKTSMFLEQRQQQLRERIGSLEEEISRWQGKSPAPEDKQQGSGGKDKAGEKKGSSGDIIYIFRKEIAALNKENEFLQSRKQKEFSQNLDVQRRREELEKDKIEPMQKIIEGMYSWIKNRQDLKAGLVLSYEGDRNLDRVYFTYDQALTAIVFMLFDDTDKAKKILDFYLEKVQKGEDIYNAYYADRGRVFEYTTHSGPNAWIGIAALNYAKRTNSKRYLPIAEKAAMFLQTMMDKEGGIRGGVTDSWYSTEHNLDAYAFFDLFYQVTKDKQYADTAQKIKEWISQYVYTAYGPPVKRGRGDSTVATDTYAWSVTAFGPRSLAALKMDPHAILEFAVNNCEVEVEFKRRAGSLNVKGFDFAKVRNLARGGVVSGEWTAQMILAFEVMADYYKNNDENKYNDYFNKSLFYFQELQKMLITSPSKAGREDPCLPYASHSSVDTGHGWRTPNGNSAGSLASTAYFLIAYLGYNPLQGESLQVSLRNFYAPPAPDNIIDINSGI